MMKVIKQIKPLTVFVMVSLMILPPFNLFLLLAYLEDLNKGLSNWKTLSMIYLLSTVIMFELILLLYYISI